MGDFYVREWDPKLKAWVLVAFADDEEMARHKGRVLWKRGAAGIKIEERRTVVLVEEMRK